MSIKLEVEVANLRARCDQLEKLTDNLFRQVAAVEMLVAEYYAANLALTQQVAALPKQGQQKTLHKPAST